MSSAKVRKLMQQAQEITANRLKLGRGVDPMVWETMVDMATGSGEPLIRAVAEGHKPMTSTGNDLCLTARDQAELDYLLELREDQLRYMPQIDGLAVKRIYPVKRSGKPYTYGNGLPICAIFFGRPEHIALVEAAYAFKRANDLKRNFELYLYYNALLGVAYGYPPEKIAAHLLQLERNYNL